MHDLDARLAGWTEAGLITPDQAAAIADHERTDALEAAVRPPPRRIAVAEAVGYVGAALALAALGLFVGELWPELATGGQLALVGLLTVLAGGAGQAVYGQSAPAMQRLTGVLWAAAALGAAWFAGIVAADVLDAGVDATATSVGGVAVVVAVPLLLRRPGLLLHLVALAGAVTTAVALLSMTPLDPDPFWYGLLVAAIGGAWLLLGWGGWLAPRHVAEVLGGLLALVGTQVASVGDLRVGALVLGLAIAGGLVTLAVLRDTGHHLVVGALGLFVLVPQLVFELFGDAIGAPATLLVVGLLLVLLAVGLGRARREVGGQPRKGGQPDPGGDDRGDGGNGDAAPAGTDERMGAPR